MTRSSEVTGAEFAGRGEVAAFAGRGEVPATPVREAYLTAAGAAARLLAEAAVAARWPEPSALPELAVGGLAAHLARTVTRVPEVLAAPVPAEPPRSLLDHFTGSAWVRADLADEVNVEIRRRAETHAADGPDAVVARTAAVAAELPAMLAAEPAGRVVRPPWTGWSLTLDDFLVTRMLEVAVHCDDLAVSVGVDPPALPPAVLDPVFDMLTRLAVHRHGAAAVLRTLSRSERAPASIAAI